MISSWYLLKYPCLCPIGMFSHRKCIELIKLKIPLALLCSVGRLSGASKSTHDAKRPIPQKYGAAVVRQDPFAVHYGVTHHCFVRHFLKYTVSKCQRW